MDSNYLVQRRLNEQKKYRRKVTLAIALGAILVVLILIGLIKVIMDEKKAEKNNGETGKQTTTQLSPGAENNSGSNQNSTGGTANSETPAPTEGGNSSGSVPVSLTPTETPTPVPMDTKKVAIDPGHGGDDLGSTRQGLYEKDANLAIALYLKEILEEKGYETYMVRETDVAVENESRPAAAIENGADIYVSIHLNSLDADSDATQGAETWYADLRDDGSDQLAQYVIDELTKVIDTRNRGIKLSNKLIVLKYNEMPACLVECGFITSETERTKLFSPDYQKKIAEGIANGIQKFLPLE